MFSNFYKKIKVTKHMNAQDKLLEARKRLIETGGRVSQDFGTGRIVGQVLVFLYLQEQESSLDDIGSALGLSKASVSIAVRQLEQLGLAKKVWKGGDKRNYYKSADNIAHALQQGVLGLVRQKVQLFSTELEGSLDLLRDVNPESIDENELSFLVQRIERAQKLQGRLEKVLGNPLVKLLTSINN
jgi:DNA-binding transcriptional regulator GbsR (MarR family)